MSRWSADGLLILTALIWGTAFIAQKTALDDMGPAAFVGFRFLLGAACLAPFAVWEMRRRAARAAMDPNPTRPHPAREPLFAGATLWLVLGIAAVFCAGALLQQYGLLATSVTNAGFLTALYVVITPLLAWALLGRPPVWQVWPAGLLAVGGVYLLSGADITQLTWGDAVVAIGAFFWAAHVVLIGIFVPRTEAPLTITALQYVLTAAVALVIAVATESISLAALIAVAPELLYAGVMSGALAFSLQAIAQRYTPPSEAAVILSSESLFAALAAVLLLGEVLTPVSAIGCALILIGILLVEVGPTLSGTRRVMGRQT